MRPDVVRVAAAREALAAGAQLRHDQPVLRPRRPELPVRVPPEVTPAPEQPTRHFSRLLPESD